MAITTTTAVDAASKPFRLGIVSCTTRAQRINPLVTAFVLETLSSHSPKASVPEANSTVEFQVIDLTGPLATAELNREFLSLSQEDQEAAVPAGLPKVDTVSHYALPSTRAWSSLVSTFDGFIFVTPQYNWSLPAPLKHALDKLYHEWSDKVGMVVSYGNRGGNLCRGQLEQVLKGCRFPTVVGLGEGNGVELKIPVLVGAKCIEQGKLEEDLVKSWKEGGMVDRMMQRFEEMFHSLEARAVTGDAGRA